ncbi:NAD dependent epimerase/dehydratase, LLPSF_EDH_00030 family [Natronincola peptidivorans]|uniref:NAD dependent epimerase/dehydratase, LLPSF_EDH_00030 family n=1 Tax=Natronincola peptidivorans TaxID=426128 RepID=A0A1H9ZRX6_9FIRM|nr:NAD-dependent 4,6-dehydratase LegB [Natronincola peptidivorans]SES84527.1 NAD dependent epimerase/dehydratase, LLPSF_EDH_00030 family [Natronincola peptidivorans]
MQLKNKKVLVTGAEGFIGSHLVERLVELGAEVTAFTLYNSFNSWGWLDTLDEKYKKHMEVFTGDARDENSVRKAVEDKDIVFHLAALIAIPYSYYAPASYVDTNVKGTLNVLQACRDFMIEKMIHTSTSEVYGTAKYVPIDEEHPLQGQSPYSASKIAADMMAESYYRSFKTPVAIMRPFNTYGPRQSARAVIPTIISQILSGAKEIQLGSLLPTRDFNYVKDTVEGFIQVAENDKTIGTIMNIGTGKEISIGHLTEKIIGLIGRDVKISCQEERLRPEKSEVNRLCACNKKVSEITNWKPKYTLDEGLKETIDWIEKNIHYFKSDIYNV